MAIFLQAVVVLPAWGQAELVCTPITDAQNTSADPVSPADCQPYTGGFNNPAIFFTPHPDDETLAMAGHIKQALSAGRTVVVELMTRGKASNAFSVVSGENDSNFPYDHSQGCSGADYVHYGSGNYPLTDTEAMGYARVRDFLDSMRRLGVQAVVIHDYPNGALNSQKITDRIQEYWLTRGVPGIGFYGTVGSEDAAFHADHAAVHDGVVNSGATPRTLLSPYAGRVGLPETVVHILI